MLFFVRTGMASCLGSLPPPSSLVSLAVSTGVTGPTLPGSIPSVSGHPIPSSQSRYSSGWTPSDHTSVMSPLSRPGLILSPASDPVPHSLVQRIQAGQFIDMRELLTDNIALLNQLSTLQPTIPLPTTAMNHTRLREIPFLASWLYCFMAYVAVRTSDPLTRDMLAYARLITRESLRHGNNGWLEYDRVFRRQISINPLLPWNTLEPSLQASTMLGQRSTTGTFCSLCRECDHTASRCALAPLQQPLQQQLSTNPPPSMSWNSRPPKRAETLLHICVAWNKNTCKRQNCTYRHICATCHLHHKARDCADTPADSEYKYVPTAAPSAPTRPSFGNSSIR